MSRITRLAQFAEIPCSMSTHPSNVKGEWVGGLSLDNFTRNQNETFVTCSPIMNVSFDVNWMTSSLINYA